MANVEGVTVEPGFITIAGSSGPPVKYPIADMLRQADIPVGLTHEQVKGVSLLANLVVIIVRTLIDRQILDDSFLEGGDYDLADIIYAVEQLGGSFSDPNFDNVEDA